MTSITLQTAKRYTRPDPGAERAARSRSWRIATPTCLPTATADRRHSFAFALAEATGSDAYELERRLGHQSQRYIHRYTNPPEDIAADYVAQR